MMKIGDKVRLNFAGKHYHCQMRNLCIGAYGDSEYWEEALDRNQDQVAIITNFSRTTNVWVKYMHTKTIYIYQKIHLEVVE